METPKIVEELLADKAKNNNTIDLDAYANGLLDMYQALQLHKTQVSGSFINNVDNLTNSILKCFPKFFDDFENWEYGTGANAGKDFHKMYKRAKRIKTNIGKNYR